MVRNVRRLRRWSAVALVGLLSAYVVGTVPASGGVTTVSVDTLRTGWDRAEPGLSPSDVGSADFGQLFATQLEGQVYAQPVVARNTLLVLTEADMAYGLDPVTGALRWSRSVGPAWSVAGLGCGDLVPQVGITSTPVVDAATGAAYFTAKVDDPKDPDHPHWELHAIDVATGQERAGFPATMGGSADNDPDATFTPRTEMQRPGLLLMDGVVYAAFGGHCDRRPFAGYVMGFDATNGRRTAVWAAQTGGNSGAGIWQSGGGLVSDGPGRILLTTGNGVSPTRGPGSTPPAQLAESVVRLQVQPDRTLAAADFFSPVNNTNLDTDDTDLGAGGPMALPDGSGTTDHPHLLVQAGKDGRVLLLDRDRLGGNGQGAGGTDAVLQTVGPYQGVWGHPGFYGGEGGYVYLIPSGAPLGAFKVGVSGSGTPALTRTGSSLETFGFGSGSPVVTSDGTRAGSALVWAVRSSGSNGVGGQLRAYDAVPSKGRLALRWSAPIGTASKFSTPATDGGRVYVANREGRVFGFGRPATSALGGRSTDLGLVAVGSTSTAKVTVTARSALSVTRVEAGAPFSTGALDLPVSLDAGESLTVPVTFRPTAPGAASTGLTLATSSGTFAFDLHGFATLDGLGADPASLDFGDVPVGGRVTLSVSVANTGATSTTVTGAKAPADPFGSEGLPAVGATLASGTSVSVPVTFEPTTTGERTSEVVVSSTTGPVHVPVTGRGVAGAPELTLSPTTLDFGDVALGLSVTKSFTLSDTGNLLLTLTKAAPPTAPFRVSTPVAEGQQIEPGDTVRQAVAFAPVRLGAFSGTYVVTGNDGQGAQSVTVRGNGVAPVRAGGPLVGPGGLCADVRWGSSADGTPVQLSTCNDSVAQSWSRPGDGSVRAVGRCLATGATPVVDRTPVQISTCSGAASQVWRLRGGSAGALVNPASGLCLDVPGGHVVERARLQVYTCNWTDAQRWVLPG